MQWRRSDGKPYDDPIHELAARNRVLIERSSFMAWSRTLPERRRVAVPAALPRVQQPAARLAVAHIAIAHSRTHTEVLERQSAANDPVPLMTEVVTPALVPLPSQEPQADLDTRAETGTAASSDPNPQVAASSWSLVTQLQRSAAISSTPQHDYATRAITRDYHLSEMAVVLRSIPGIGPVASSMLIAEMPEIGTITGEEAAALTGLAPVAHDSGTFRGKRAIAGGRRALRHVMFQAALVAAHHNPNLRSFANRLRKAGKPHKVIITAVARKLVTIANALCKIRQKWVATAP